MIETEDNIESKIVVKNREDMLITGIKKIECLNTNEFVLDTVLGNVNVKGKNLEMTSLNIDSGELSISGYIDSIAYDSIEKNQEKNTKKENFLNKLFK